ncbi:MarR family transcriptional regulator [Mesobacillus subterraneus]|uniref:MarR family winged helix-turn-helix transcriptional regulator n=1 Tax=Mesobacillus subterraneus TaxID=285983 RepID=UPI002041F550|nr:MarR family transcriptional regulator [Mesobacillus subterraneus]MCM3666745.1 MarR family transcriptional regulator [Mesobacillus subterraneus]MCM3685642.1 MarR family transcriptional regulator [Mesobacillus subterraneus]
MDITMDKAIGSASVRLSKKLTRIINIYLKPYNITTEQWSVLRTLSDSDEISQKELSQRSDKDQATLTKILDLLVKHELVERLPNPADRRSFLIKITAKGGKIVHEVTPYLEKIFLKITREISEEKLLMYREVLLSLEANIDGLLEQNN